MKSTLILFTLGVLLCTTLAATSCNSPDGSITLTEDNHIVFSGVVDDSSVAKAQLKLGQLSARLGKSDVIYLVLDTPGGSVSAGNQFIDFAKSIPQTIKPISIFAASMGYHMFQSFDERIMQSSSTIMSHRVSLGGLSGQVPGEFITRLNWIIATSNEMDATAAKRVGTTVEAYRKLIHDELWLNGTDAVATKHADRLAKIRCSSDLIKGTRTEQVNTIFGPVDVTFSTCPIINGFLDFKFVGKASNIAPLPFLIPRNNEEVVREIKRVKRKVVMEIY